MTVKDTPDLTDIEINSFSTVALNESGNIASELIDKRGLTLMPLVYSYDCAFLDVKSKDHTYIHKFSYDDSIHIEKDTLPDGFYNYILFLKDCTTKDGKETRSRTQNGQFRVSAGIFGDYSDIWY